MESINQAYASLSDAIDFTLAVERNYVHQDVQCDVCFKSIAGVRFRCANCADFDLCSQCHLTGATARHDSDHTFYWIQYRRVSLPPANGEDLELLQRFKDGTTSESFYLHYPWFVESSIFEGLIKGTENENEHRAMLMLRQGSSELSTALDRITRLCAPEDWNWRQVQDFIQPLLQLQLVRSQYSGIFYSLYSIVKERNEHIHDSETGEAATILYLRKQLYSTRLDSLSTTKCRDAMNEFLAARLNSNGALEIPTQDGISELAKYTDMLAKEFDLNSHSFPTFQQAEALLKRRETGQLDWSISKSLKGWQAYDSAYKALVSGVRTYITRCSNIPIVALPCMASSRSDDPALASFSSLVLRRNFKAAADIISELNHSNPIHLFTIARFHEIRGSFSKAYRTLNDGVNSFQGPTEVHNDVTTIFSRLFKLCRAYFGCSTEGKWTEALEIALNTLEDLNSGEEVNILQHPMQLYFELYSFKILLLAANDKYDLLQVDFVSSIVGRLHQLQQISTRIGATELALDILDLEFHTCREQETIFELEQTEYLYHRTNIICSPQPAIRRLEDFLSTLRLHQQDRHLGGSLSAEFEASARLILCYALAENQLDDSEIEFWKNNLRRIWQLFENSDTPLGRAEVALFGLQHRIDSNASDVSTLDDIQACFHDHGHLIGLLKFHKWKLTLELIELAGIGSAGFLVPTSPKMLRQLLPITKEMGNELLFRTYQVRSMRNWIEGASFILLCEKVFHPTDGFLSDQLFLESSKLLCQLYEGNNNFTESSAFALVHLRLAFARDDSMLLDMATTLHFRCMGNMVTKVDYDDRIYEVVSLTSSFDLIIARMCNSILIGMESPDSSIAAWSLPIESLLWPATLIRHITENDGIHSMSSLVIRAVHRSIKLALDFTLLLPDQYHALFLPAICQALGEAAEMIANPTLALLCYDLGQSDLAKKDEYRQAISLARIGRRLASWIHDDRQDFIAFQDVAFTYLDQAVEFFWNEGSRQSSYRNGLEASVTLARSHLTEVQWSIEETDWGEDVGDEEALTDEQQANKQRLLNHIAAGLLPIQNATRRNRYLRKSLSGLPAMQALENRRLLYSGDMAELYWNEMGLLMDQSRITKELKPLLVAIQKWKAVSLQDTISQRLQQDMQPVDVLMTDETETRMPNALKSLDYGEDPPNFEEESLWDMARIAEDHLEAGQRLIFVDWTRYYDTLFMTAYDATDGRMWRSVVELDYSKIELWVNRELGVTSLQQGRIERKRLHQFKKFKELTPILDGLLDFITPGDLVVLCPSGVLHAIPLHAIPFPDKPLITSNPVVFCPSFSLLQTCVNNVQGSAILSTIPAVAFTRIGPGDPEEESRVSEAARNGLSDDCLQTNVISGRDVTRDTFISHSRGARLLHYHGHAYLEPVQRRDRALQLEPQPASATLYSDNGLLTVMDIFDLQLDSAVVLLLACASGEDDVAPNDDPLGLLSAFLYSGASSVLATRWPTQTSDAREFAKRFYSRAFKSRKDSIINLAAAFQATVLSLWEDWDEDDPYHWAQFQLYGSWFGKI